MNRSPKPVNRPLIALLVLLGALIALAVYRKVAVSKPSVDSMAQAPVMQAAQAGRVEQSSTVTALVPAMVKESPVANRPVNLSVAPTTAAEPSVSPVPSTPSTPPATAPAVLAGPASLPAASQPVNGVPSPRLLADAQAKLDTEQWLAARNILNDALIGGALNDGDTASAKEMLGRINRTMLLSARRFDNDPFAGVYSVKSGDRPVKIAADHDMTWELLCKINNLADPKKLRAGASLKVLKGPFHAVVRKRWFVMDLFLGNPGQKGSLYVMSFPVGLGKDDSTPTGTWLVQPHQKLMNPAYFSPRGEGIIAADDPKNPLGERWIGLTGTEGSALGQKSYGIHGTIDPQSVGKQESLGCIRMKNEDVEVVYDLLVEGRSTVVVKE